jgi:hypothetical protein
MVTTPTLQPHSPTGTTMNIAATDRRGHPRRIVVPNRAALDWGTMTRDGGGDARFLDISRGGASLETRDAPQPGQMVWIRLESPAATPWITATVARRDASQVGIQFQGECPDDLMLAATLGISLIF